MVPIKQFFNRRIFPPVEYKTQFKGCSEMRHSYVTSRYTPMYRNVTQGKLSINWHCCFMSNWINSKLWLNYASFLAFIFCTKEKLCNFGEIINYYFQLWQKRSLTLIPQHYYKYNFLSTWATKSCSGFCHVRFFTYLSVANQNMYQTRQTWQRKQ